MEKYPLLKNAPITEAVVDIRVKVADDFDVNSIDFIHDLLIDKYPEKQEQVIQGFKITNLDGSLKHDDLKIQNNGYRYISKDKKQVVQARLDGYTFSRLQPYPNWNEIRDEAFNNWKFYKEITKPSITRVALRYINNLQIPMPINDLSQFLTSPPNVPKGLPQGINSFLTRIVLSDDKINANIIITQALDKIIDPKVAPVILDIDVFKLKQDGFSENEAWSVIEELRSIKNEVFFQSITQKLKELYQ